MVNSLITDYKAMDPENRYQEVHKTLNNTLKRVYSPSNTKREVPMIDARSNLKKDYRSKNFHRLQSKQGINPV